MADDVRMALAELLRKAEADPGLDVVREGVRVLAEAVMDLEVEQHLGASRHERSPERDGHRNGYRERQWDTRVGTIDLRVPRVRDGSYFPALLAPRTRGERALVAVVQEAYVGGVSTRRVDGLVKALGMEGISKSQVIRNADVDYRNGTKDDACPACERRGIASALPGGGGSGRAQSVADAVVAG